MDLDNGYGIRTVTLPPDRRSRKIGPRGLPLISSDMKRYFAVIKSLKIPNQEYYLHEYWNMNRK